MKRVAIIFNPIAGRGRSRIAAERLEQVLQERGITTQLLETRKTNSLEALTESLAGCSAVVVAGGDGTLMELLHGLAEMQLPLYAMPTGNQSLFAQLFGMSDRAEVVADALTEGRVEQHRYGTANGVPFFHMVSFGLDAWVIENVASRRIGPISNCGYIIPALQSLVHYSSPVLDLDVDGKRELSGQKGYLVVANSSIYACGFNPVPEASSNEDSLVARFFPGYTRSDFLRWSLHFLRRTRIASGDSVLFRGKHMTILAGDDVRIQADGEFLGRGNCTIALASTTLRVLVPTA